MNAEESEWLAETQEATSGKPAILRRGEASVPIIVIYGRVTHERYALADGRAQLDVEPADFWVRPKWYDFGAGTVEPERGDRIEFEGRTYEVTPRDGEKCFKTDNQYRTQFCLRTIRVPSSAVSATR